MSAAARLSDVGAASCRRCGRLVAMLRAEVPLVPRASPSLYWADSMRECRCEATLLPRPASLPSSIRVRLREVVAASAGARPWEQLVTREPLEILV
ncbi:hypothetical protein KMZ32_08250 [Phycicoccus sp. MAQZ13P-2]|uniref:hypothetical protein n=1 Tax=Phycicoccus mangrovi TaxID=2840470 RepID=UPI001C00717F|nr:hypothetical protein [Phycicoccus mangrovi]MBT9255078.1 hypothetical protein [Phycicoccus mangrovi]MBT9274062.1 hypothetical protein [Phycicoccus mangrovi]